MITPYPFGYGVRLSINLYIFGKWVFSVACYVCFASCKTFDKQPKRPCLVRAAAPYSAPARMPGVYAQGLCKDAKPTKHTQPFTTGKGFGDSARMPR